MDKKKELKKIINSTIYTIETYADILDFKPSELKQILIESIKKYTKDFISDEEYEKRKKEKK